MLRTAFAVIALVFSTLVAAQNYPGRPIRLIVPFPPGGTNELLSRIISQ